MMQRTEPLRRVVDQLPLGTDPHSVRRRVVALERLLENAIPVPGMRRGVGLDAIIGLLPVAGDTIAALLGLYLVFEARNAGLPRWQILRMLGNVGFDAILGVVPFAGDVLDVFYRSNTRNLKIILKHLDRHHPATQVLEM